MPFRVEYWVPLGIFIVVSTILYVRLLILIFNNRSTKQYSTFFYKMFFISGLLDILAVFWYVTVQLLYVDKILGNQFLLDISHDNIPNLFYYYLFYFLYAQIFVITLVSANRVYAVYWPMSKILTTCDQFPTIILLLATTIFPILITIHFFFQPTIEFQQNAKGRITRNISPETTMANTIHSVCVVTVANIFSAICYLSVGRKIVHLNRTTSSRTWRKEISLTVVGFSTFVSLCLATCYFAVTYYATITDLRMLTSITPLNIIHYFSLAFVNPWMLVITSGSIRKRIFSGQPSVILSAMKIAPLVPATRTTEMTTLNSH